MSRKNSLHKIAPDWATARRLVEQWQQAGEEVVFTNGCFDWLHLGHIDTLEAAARLGDRLVVGLNSDASVSRLKGSARPVSGEVSRARVLAALAAVDLVVIFEQDTPAELIAVLQPDVLAKGGDYSDPTALAGYETIVEKGGNVVLLPFAEGFSTSILLEKSQKKFQ